MQTINPIAVCSPYLTVFGLLRDQSESLEETSWEKFGPHSVPKYFAEGIHALRQHLVRLEDPSKPYTPGDENRLWFMVESLIQARRLIEDTRSEA
jgi:hypothetical protein